MLACFIHAKTSYYAQNDREKMVQDQDESKPNLKNWKMLKHQYNQSHLCHHENVNMTDNCSCLHGQAKSIMETRFKITQDKD